jgi:hypothetical protein
VNRPGDQPQDPTIRRRRATADAEADLAVFRAEVELADRAAAGRGD